MEINKNHSLHVFIGHSRANKNRLKTAGETLRCIANAGIHIATLAVFVGSTAYTGAGATSDTCSELNIPSISASTDDGNVAASAIDGNLTTRWSGFGVGAHITADLGSPHSVCSVSVAWYQGNLRANFFVISTSPDGVTYHDVYSGTSSGASLNLESYTFTPTTARNVRITVNGNTINNWASITELKVLGRSAYDGAILDDHPVAFWDMNSAGTTEPDLSGYGNTGTYQGGLPRAVTMLNGDRAALFDGATQYLSVPSKPSLSIPTTGNLTWEVWIQPTVLDFPNNSNGYVAYMGKCASYKEPICEWEARMYNADSDRSNRLSAYAFNPIAPSGSDANYGSGAFWQPTDGQLKPGHWLHVVGEYTTKNQPQTPCLNTSTYPGTIDIWVNGVKWDQASHGQTGCMSQYSVKPKANNSPLNIATLAYDSWFKGAIGKVAIYDYLLTDPQIKTHYQAMTPGK